MRVINVPSSALRFRLMPFIGLVFNNSCRSLFVSGALEVLEQEISPHSFPTGSSKKYRKSLALGLFYKVLNNFIVLSTIFFFRKNCRPGQVWLKAIRYKLMLLLSDNIPNWGFYCAIFNRWKLKKIIASSRFQSKLFKALLLLAIHDDLYRTGPTHSGFCYDRLILNC